MAVFGSSIVGATTSPSIIAMPTQSGAEQKKGVEQCLG
jgi:hypothetical protein